MNRWLNECQICFGAQFWMLINFKSPTLSKILEHILLSKWFEGVGAVSSSYQYMSLVVFTCHQIQTWPQEPCTVSDVLFNFIPTSGKGRKRKSKGSYFSCPDCTKKESVLEGL